MSRLARILSELVCLGIPGGCCNSVSYGVRMIIAEYAYLSDCERTLMLLQIHGGKIQLSNDECRLGVRIHETRPGFVIVSGT